MKRSLPALMLWEQRTASSVPATLDTQAVVSPAQVYVCSNPNVQLMLHSVLADHDWYHPNMPYIFCVLWLFPLSFTPMSINCPLHLCAKSLNCISKPYSLLTPFFILCGLNRGGGRG